jgi:hypothetical protein
MQTATTTSSTDGPGRAAYRRLALVILRLDVPTLTSDLRAKHTGQARPTPLARPAARSAA